MGKALHRPTLFKTPRWALRLALGEMADAILESQRALPEKLLKNGFVFEYGTLDSALANLIGKKHERPLP